MCIYVWQQNNVPAVKVGMSMNPPKRIINTDHWYPKIIKGIYQITKTNGMTLTHIDKDIKKEFKKLNIRSPHYENLNMSSPTEFYRPEIIPELDKYFENLKQKGKIDYIKFYDLEHYEKNKVIIDEETEYDLRYCDLDYENINLECEFDRFDE